jgi:hypothetical protein
VTLDAWRQEQSSPLLQVSENRRPVQAVMPTGQEQRRCSRSVVRSATAHVALMCAVTQKRGMTGTKPRKGRSPVAAALARTQRSSWSPGLRGATRSQILPFARCPHRGNAGENALIRVSEAFVTSKSESREPPPTKEVPTSQRCKEDKILLQPMAATT